MAGLDIAGADITRIHKRPQSKKSGGPEGPPQAESEELVRRRQPWTTSPCRLMSRPSSSTSSLTRMPMVYFSAARITKVTTPQ